MKHFTGLLFSILFIAGLSAQEYNRLPVISKVTATWCPNCGNWGWDYMEALKEEFDDNSAVLLGVHHSGLLENPVSNWFANNLNNFYQPQFFVNNEMIDVSSSNWPQKVEEIRNLADMVASQQAATAVSFRSAFVNAGNQLVAELDIAPVRKSDGEYFIAVYIFENNVEEFQSQQGQDALHPWVLRDVMAGEYWGQALNPGQSEASYLYDLDATNWDPDEIGLLAITWEKSGNSYIMDNAAVVYNAGLLSSSAATPDAVLFDIWVGNGSITLSAPEGLSCDYMILSNEGRMIRSGSFDTRADIQTTDLIPGIYIINIGSETAYYSKQLFIR